MMMRQLCQDAVKGGAAGRCHFLGIIQARRKPGHGVLIEPGGGDGDRTGPGAAAGLVNADDRTVKA